MPFQSFQLSRQPLTFVSAPTRAGAESTLQVRVNGIRWHEADALLDLGPSDRGYVTSRDEQGTVSIEMGDGIHGTRLPTGIENVRASYRVGLGTLGNVKAGSITLPPGEPFGIKAVNNLLPTSGGAEPEGNEQIREYAPLGVKSFDRLVSVVDYADFARTFAGIGKADARKIETTQRASVLVTVDGTGDTPLQVNSDVVRNLRQAYRRLGDPDLPLIIRPAERLILMLQGSLGIHPDHSFDKVSKQAVQALLTEFGFEARRLGQDVYLSDVFSVLQRVDGVTHVDIDVLQAVPQRMSLTEYKALGSETGELPRRKIPVNMAGVRRYTVAVDDESVKDIAANFAVLEAELKLLNPAIKDWEHLKEGTVLTVSVTWPAQIAYFGIPDVIVLKPV